MPPIFYSGNEFQPALDPAMQVLNFFNLDDMINSFNMTSQMRFLLEHNDKIAIGRSKIFYLDPYTLRNYEDSYNYCNNLNMTVALPTDGSENDLMARLMRKWNSYIRTQKFNSIETWLAAGLSNKRKIGKLNALVLQT